MKKYIEKSFVFPARPAGGTFFSIRFISAIRGQLYLLKSLPVFRAFRVFRGQNFFRLLLSFLLLPFYFQLFTCSFLTNPDKTTISGTVKLEAQTNHSGVKVSLYKLIDLDTTLVGINQQYPNIGVQISPKT
ncbi:MAG TPA: hypothetical protein ENH26_03190 [Candidatus Wolfebacteria bacterium]|nr:hypothetical protein [Candidatus Wolfebacteria bacterium]